MDVNIREILESPFLLVDACSYCWGAAATTSAILKHVDSTIPIVFIGSGSSLEFFQNNDCCSYYVESNTESFQSLAKNRELIEKSLFCFINVNPVMAIAARRLKTKVVYLDILPWLEPSLEEKVKTIATLHSNSEYLKKRDEVISLLGSCEIYYQQLYFSSYPQDKNIQNLKKVPPILNEELIQKVSYRSHTVSNRLMINLGGFFNPDVPVENLIPYLECLLAVAESLISSQVYKEVIICTSNRVVDSLKNINRNEVSNLYMKTFPQDKYLMEMSSSKHVAIVPGLSSIYEAFSVGRPTLLLPPTNYSQVHQINAVYDAQLAIPLVAEVIPKEVRKSILSQPEVEGTRTLMKVLDLKIKEGEMTKSLLEGFRWLEKSYLMPLSSERNQFMKEIGIQGAQIVASDIERLWRKLTK